MSELPPDVRSFLDAARPAHLADRGDRERARKALAACLLLPPLGDAGSPAPPADAPSVDAPPVDAPPVAPPPVALPAPAPSPPALAPTPAPVVPPSAVAASSGALLAAKKVVIGAALFASGGASTMVYERVASEPARVVSAVASAAPSSGRGPWRAPARRPGRPEAIASDDSFEGGDEVFAQAEPSEVAVGPVAPLASAAEVVAPVASAVLAAPEITPPSVVASARPNKRGENAASALGSKGEVEAPASAALPPELAPSPPGSAAASAAPIAASTVAEELRLVRAAQSQLSAGRAEGALATLAEHARLYPQGALREERAAARVLALCALGRSEQAKSEADAFVRAAPHSPYAGGLRRPCEGARGR